MTTKHFQTSTQGFQRRKPFKRYTVELAGGRRVPVDHSEALVIRGGVGVFVDASGAPTILDHEGVSQIFAGTRNSAKA